MRISTVDRTRRPLIVLLITAGLASFTVQDAWAAEDTAKQKYHEIVAADRPVAYWRMEELKPDGTILVEKTATKIMLDGKVAGKVAADQPGPRPRRFPMFAGENRALQFGAAGGFVRVADPGEGSPLDFTVGDTITMEAWIDLYHIQDDKNIYIVGKGRTKNPGVADDNQNYAMRLRGRGNQARLSFLFRDDENRAGKSADYHRWNSDINFAPDSGWHHVVVVYTFGKPESMRGYLDGHQVKGTWDFGGATTLGPVVDDDELWIGSSLGGNSGSTFTGLIDEVALYRHALSPEQVARHFQIERSVPPPVENLTFEFPADTVRVEIHEGVPEGRPWRYASPTPYVYSHSQFAWTGLPKKYSEAGLMVDRSGPFLVRALTKITLPEGEYDLLVRAKNRARVLIDGKLAVEQAKALKPNGSGHESVPELVEPFRAGLRPLPAGHQEQWKTVSLKGGEHTLRLEAIVGGQKLATQLGELCVAIAPKGGAFTVLSPAATSSIPLTDEAWQSSQPEMRNALVRIDQQRRRAVSTAEAAYWQKRHAQARLTIASGPAISVPEVSESLSGNNEIDRFIGRRLLEEKVSPGPVTSDYAFLRRVTLDTVGVIPSDSEIAVFFNDPAEDRREQAIDRLLQDPRWADHWVGYWQDVLAENPSILKPTLNNTGPFRWWIYESFLDNKPFDQFVTELILMQGSSYGGGPAGFAMASQNDVPMAAKAHILGQAFLGVNMKCARCHDAPNHPFTQPDLFQIAAMLNRKPIELPKSSSVPLAEGARQPAVSLSLRPGDKVKPKWPFHKLFGSPLPDEELRDPKNMREQLASAIVSPQNERFAQVAANRLWHRYLGRGLVNSVDDWDELEPSHPELLKYLAGELVTHDYDLKHIARQILNSQTYQREIDRQGKVPPELFASAGRRQLSAEQLVDSLFSSSGKFFYVEPLTLDPEGRRPNDTFPYLGVPSRAWQFTSLSNERDRPALSLPMAQSINDLLKAYGWRNSRQAPLTEREQTPTPTQALTLANGLTGRRAVVLSDDHAVTDLCLAEKDLDTLVRQLYVRYLTRQPTPEELATVREVLQPGFANRRVPGAAPSGFVRQWQRHAVSWSNHLHPKATEIMLALEKNALRGDPPTKRLQADWRERMEDVLWALINSPEFVFIP